LTEKHTPTKAESRFKRKKKYCEEWEEDLRRKSETQKD
jgi:hypothetical protein